MNSERQHAIIQARGRMERCRADIVSLQQTLSQVTLWRPATGLMKQCRWATERIDAMASRLEKTLVVTMVGPSGAGKSTLFNALVGTDDLSTVGTRRPTTQRLVAMGNRDESVSSVVDAAAYSRESLHIVSRKSFPEDVILVDTPDIDTVHHQETIGLVKDAVGLCDVLICVFDAENPKRRDAIDDLTPYLNRFEGHSLVMVLNKCDRLDETELTELIVPEFTQLIRNVWAQPNATLLYVSARGNLQQPHWDNHAAPKHNLDQFSQLKRMVFNTFSKPGFGMERRLANARHLCTYLFNTVKSEAKRDQSSLAEARHQVQKMQQSAMQEALMALKTADIHSGLGTHVLLYQKLAQRWVGPVGWLIALWSRILVFGSGLAGLVRFGNPVSQVAGAISSYKQYRKTREAVSTSRLPEGLDAALKAYRTSQRKTWPDIAQKLISGRFDNAIRHPDATLAEADLFTEDLAKMWYEALEKSLKSAARILSHPFLQILCNLPVVALLGYIGWITLSTFYHSQYLSSDFFLHAFLTIAIVLALIFFVFQILVGALGRDKRLLGTAFKAAQGKIHHAGNGSMDPLIKELDRILRFCDLEPPLN